MKGESLCIQIAKENLLSKVSVSFLLQVLKEKTKSLYNTILILGKKECKHLSFAERI